METRPRSNVSNFQPGDSITQFSTFNLHSTIMFVFCVVSIRLLLTVIAKLSWFNFKQEPVLKKVRYFLLNLGATPVASQNFQAWLSFTELGEKLQQQFRETVVLLFLHLVENIVLAVPVLLSHLNISARHLLLQRSVGVLPIETESLENSRALVVATLTTIPLGFCLQSALFWLYTQRGHIWAAAVREERAEQEAASDEEMENERVERASLQF